MRKAGSWLILLPITALCVHAQVYTYQLLPGSTIAPMAGAVVTGPAEQMTGTFQLQPGYLDTTFSVLGFQYVDLNFASASYSFSLLASNRWNCSMAFGGSGPEADFSADVNISGLSTNSGTISCYPNEGTYVGPYDAPTELDFPTLRIGPLNGGYWVGQMSLKAVLVPEPCSGLLLGTGALVAYWWKRRRAQWL